MIIDCVINDLSDKYHSCFTSTCEPMMSLFIVFFLVLISVFGDGFCADGQNGPSLRAQDDQLDKNQPYCFHFTWLGSSYDASTFFRVENKTCSDVFNATGKDLCIDPMAVSDTGKQPNISYILDKYPKDATCKLSEDQICAKYTVYYNGIPSQVTRYCTRIDVESEGPLRFGCLVERKGAYAYEVCACRSEPGRKGICNSGRIPDPNWFALLLVAAIFVT